MSTDQIFASDQHLIQSFADLNSLKQGVDRLAIAAGKGTIFTTTKASVTLMAWVDCGVSILDGNAEVIKAITKQLETLISFQLSTALLILPLPSAVKSLPAQII